MTVEISKELFKTISKDMEISNIKEFEHYRDIMYYNDTLSCIVFKRINFVSGVNYYIIDIDA